MKKTLQTKIMSILAVFGLLFGTASSAMAGSVTVTNDNEATIINSVTVSARSGGNSSRGGDAERGGAGGSTSGQGSMTAGMGGMGGNGGHGGNVTTGSSIATAEIMNDLNSTETMIEEMDMGDDEQYDETVSIRSSTGSSRSGAEAEAWSHDDDSNGSSSEDNLYSNDEMSDWMTASWYSSSDTDSSDTDDSSSTDESSSSASSSWSQTEDSDHSTANSYNNAISESVRSNSSYEEEVHDDYALDYTRTYVGDDEEDTVGVTNSNSASATNNIIVDAMSGANHSQGARGVRGGDAGNAWSNTSSTTGQWTAAGNGGNGGQGGMGGTITSGIADSLSNSVTVSGRTMTRVVRH